MQWLYLVLCAIIGYLLGNVQTGLIVARLAKGVDLRKYGSGGSGATNALRVLGKKYSAMTFVGDCLKGILAVVIGRLLAGQDGGMVACLAVIVGHIWPAFYGFHGGKGAATSIGAILVLFPWQGLIMLAVGVVVLLITKIVSLGSIVGALAFLIAASATAISQRYWFMLVYAILMVALILFAHRGNIVRLMHGKEDKITNALKKK